VVPWLLDGNNLARGGDRAGVRRAALGLARHERVRIVVFFDGAPPPGGNDTERLGQVEVRYAAHADTAIVGFLTRAGTGWKVATDDRALTAAVRNLGAEAVPGAAFRRKAEAAQRTAPSRDANQADLGSEMAYLSDPSNRLPEQPVRVRPRGANSKRRKR
jgi:hypothetical protein